jgi:hypothetical protein
VRASTTFLMASGIAIGRRQPVHVDVHEATERARCLVVVAKQRKLVDDARSAQPLDREPGVESIGEARGAEELAARFRHDANGRQFTDVDTACLDQEPVHGGIEVRIVGHVVDVAIVVVIHPARGDGAEEPEIRPAMMGDVGHDGRGALDAEALFVRRPGGLGERSFFVIARS